MGTVDLLAIVYAYLLNFLILGIIIISVAVMFAIVRRRAGRETRPETQAAVTQPEVVEEVVKPEESMKEKIAAAVAAVASHMFRVPSQEVGALPQPRMVAYAWVQQWRYEVNRSPNELCAAGFLYRRSYHRY